MDVNDQPVSRMPDPRPSTNSYPTYNYRDLRSRPKPEWAIQNFLQAQGVALLHGDPGSYKSFITHDIAAHLATGADFWAGHRILRPRRTLYILAEGVSFFPDRQEAWLRLHDKADEDMYCENFRMRDMAINLLNPNHVEATIGTAHEFGAEVVILDTYSRMIVGENENDASVVTKVIEAMDRIARGINGACLGVHHNSKEGKFRGSTVLDGAMDMRMETQKENDGVTVVCHKMKNGAPFEPIRFQMTEFGPSVVPVQTTATGGIQNAVPQTLSGGFRADAPF